MATYKLTDYNAILLLNDDGTTQCSIPKADGNRHYNEYLAWLAEGNTPLPVDVPSLGTVKATIWEKIKTERTRRQNGGYKVVVDAVDKWFHSDQASRIQVLALVQLGANIPAGLQWKTMDGTFVTMTPALAAEVVVNAAISDLAIFEVAEYHRIAMESLTTNAAVLEYSFVNGWPKIYGE